MHNTFLRLASVLMLSLLSPAWAGSCQPLVPNQRVELSALDLRDLQLSGELRYFRHIDSVTGRGAVSLYVDGKEIPLDFRQFRLDILLPMGRYAVKGHWSKEQRLVVTAAHPTGDDSRKAGFPATASGLR